MKTGTQFQQMTDWARATAGDGVTIYECDNAVLITQSRGVNGNWHVMVFCEEGE